MKFKTTRPIRNVPALKVDAIKGAPHPHEIPAGTVIEVADEKTARDLLGADCVEAVKEAPKPEPAK